MTQLTTINTWRQAQVILVAATVFALTTILHTGYAAPPDPSKISIVFPSDPAVLDAKRDFGAKGDGMTDDTEALQRGLDGSCGMNGKPTKVLFVPNGVYRVTKTLVVKNGIGPYLYGQSRDGVIFRLADHTANCTSVIRTHPNDGGKTSADWFMRNLRNFTVDVGDNPETDGIRYHATNSGIIKNVRVIGQGKIGINAGFLELSGPNLIQDVTIEGFETGIQSQWIWGETLSRITIKNCRKQGIYVTANAVAIEDLTVENTPVALVCDYPNDWKHWGGVVALLGAKLNGNMGSGPAIKNRSLLYARNVQTKGYKTALDSDTPSGNVTAPNIAEYTSHEPKKLFDAPSLSLNLPIKREPDIAWENDPKKWVCINDFGAVAGDNKDDTEAFQKAIDAAAAKKATIVYLRGIGGGDPNWYNLEGEVYLRGTVRYVLALGFGRILGSAKGRFIVDDTSAPVVKFQNIDAFGGTPVTIENRSANRTLVVESSGVQVVGTGTGDIFMTDCPARVDLQHPGQKLWARQLNPEGNDDIGLVRNKGSDLWVLGMKCEGVGVRVQTADGGRTEIAGTFLYDTQAMKRDDPRPLFTVDNASLSLIGLRELCFAGDTYFLKVREKRGTETKVWDNDHEGGWIGWSLFSAWQAPATSQSKKN